MKREPISQAEGEELILRAAEEARRETGQRVTLTLTVTEAVSIVSQLQLAARHPRNHGGTRDIAARYVREVLEQLRAAGCPASARLVELGEDAVHDR